MIRSKSIALGYILCLVWSSCCGQSFFFAENDSIPLGTEIRQYNFGYQYGDSLRLVLIDSVILHSNKEKTVLKTITYSNYSSTQQPSIQIQYKGVGGRDSSSKHFEGKNLTSIYRTLYDIKGRVSNCSLAYNDSANREGFIKSYEYRDSALTSGRLEICAIYNVLTNFERSLDFRIFSEFDLKGRKIKETRGTWLDDPFAMVTKYEYNELDSLVDEYWECLNILSSPRTDNDSLCFIEEDYNFSSTDFASIEYLIRSRLIGFKEDNTMENCDLFSYYLKSTDKSKVLWIVNWGNRSCEPRKVLFTQETSQ